MRLMHPEWVIRTEMCFLTQRAAYLSQKRFACELLQYYESGVVFLVCSAFVHSRLVTSCFVS